MKWSDERAELFAALAKAQAEIGKLVASQVADVKTSKGPGYSYTYAGLADALNACRPVLAANGIAVVQDVRNADGRPGIEVVTTLVHASGQWMRSEALFMPVSQNNAQAVGSAITYARRYQLLPMVGLAPQDDDGAEATDAAPPRWSEEPPRTSERSRPAPKPDPLLAEIDACCHELAARFNTSIATAFAGAVKRAGIRAEGVTSPADLNPGQRRLVHSWILGKLDESAEQEPAPESPDKLWVLDTWESLVAQGDHTDDESAAMFGQWANVTPWPDEPTDQDWADCAVGLRTELEG